MSIAVERRRGQDAIWFTDLPARLALSACTMAHRTVLPEQFPAVEGIFGAWGRYRGSRLPLPAGDQREEDQQAGGDNRSKEHQAGWDLRGLGKKETLFIAHFDLGC